MSNYSLKNFSLFAFKTSKTLQISRGLLALWLLILAWYLFNPAAVDHLWISFLFLFLLFGYIAVTSLAIGRIVGRWFNLQFSNLEFNLLAFLLGLGLLSMSIMVIGMIGWLSKTGIFACLVVVGFLASFEWHEIAWKTWAAIGTIRKPPAKSVYEIVLLILITGLIPLLIVNALTPVWDYDALLYHLEIPRQFLSHGRIYFDPEVMRSAYPFLGEMLFMIGLVFRLDSLAKFINLTYAILFVLSTYAFASRFFNREVALIAIGILVSTPIFVIWATVAGIDFVWAVYEFWAVYAISLWLAGGKKDTRIWLILGGIMSAFAASTKYISLPAFFILSLVILWKTIQGSNRPFAEAFRNLLIFGISFGLVMGIWYIKNWIWTGNPIYPLLFGGTGWDVLKNQIFNNDYMKTFGLSRNLRNFILLPYEIYAQHSQFSTLPLEIVHPLLWLGFLFPFIIRSKKYSSIILYTFVYYVWWFLGSQVIRFLIPISAFLAILAGSVLERFPSLLKNILKFTLIAGFMIFNLVYQISVLRNSGTFSYIAGRTSAEEILGVFVDDYRLKQYIQQSLKQDEHALFLWDGRGYYCDSRCIPDNDQSHAVRLALNSPDPEVLAKELQSQRITYLMLSNVDANWFVQYHDPHDYHQLALDYFEKKFLPACGKSVYKEDGIELFKIVCSG